MIISETWKEQYGGGWWDRNGDCIKDLIGLGITFVGVVTTTTPIGAVLWGIGFIYSSATLGC